MDRDEATEMNRAGQPQETEARPAPRPRGRTGGGGISLLRAEMLRRIGQWLPRIPVQYRTVVCVGNRWVKLVHVSGRGPARKIDRMLARPITGMSEEELLRWFKALWAEQRLEPGEVLVANPSALTTLRIVLLPSTDLREIRDIVELQAEKYTPYAKEEILSDSVVLEKERSGYSRVLVAISHQEVVHRALKLLQGMNWTLERVGFEMEGLSHWLRLAAPHEASESGLLVVELDAEATAVALFQNGKMRSHRSLALGGELLKQDFAAGQNRLVMELQRTLEAFDAEGLNLKISRVLLTGCAEPFPALGVAVEQALGIPTRVVSAWEGLPLAEEVLAEGASPVDVSFASLAGLALGESEVDLTPKAIKLQRAFEVRSRALVQVGCQLVAGLLLLSCWAVGRAQQEQRYLARLTQEHDRLAQEGKVLSAFLDQLKLVRQWMGLSAELLDAVDEIQRRTPEAIRWTQLAYQRSDRIILRGISPEVPKVFDFVKELKGSPRFRQVEARRTSKGTVQGQDVVEFEIVCTLASSGEAPA